MAHETRTVIEIQGMQFRVKPTTRRNVTAMRSHFTTDDPAALAQDEFEQYFDLLKIITEPVGDASFEKIDVDDLDVKTVESALVGFLPTLTATYAGLIGSLPS